MKFNLGDRVVIKSSRHTVLSGTVNNYSGYIGTIVSLPEEYSTGNDGFYGVNFGRKIHHLWPDGSKKLLTHNLCSVLKHPYGQFVHEDDLRLFAYKGVNLREEQEAIINNGDEVNALI